MNKLAILAAAFSLVPASAFAADETQSVQAAASNAAAASTVAAAPVSVTAGRMIYGADGQRIAAAYRVTSQGAVQVILNGRLVNVPAATLSDVGGKVTTSLTKQELNRAR